MSKQYKRQNSINPTNTPNIPHFTSIRTDCTHKQGGGLSLILKIT